MPSRITKFVIIALLVLASCYLFYLNPTPVDVSYAPGQAWKAPLAFVLVCTFFAGAVTIGLFALFIGVRRSFADWREGQRQKRLTQHRDLVLRAREQFAFGNYVEARAIFQAVTDQDQSNIPCWLLLSQTYEALGDVKGALSVLDRARITQRENAELLLRAAELNEKLGNLTAAQDNIALLLTRHPANRLALRRAVSYARTLQRLDDAATYLRALLKTGESAEQQELSLQLAEVELARLQSTVADSPDTLRQALLEFLRQHRDFPPALADLAGLELARGENGAAAKLLSRAYEVSGSLSYLRRLADLWLGLHNPDKAVSAVQSTIVSRSQSTATTAFFISLLLHLELLDQAARELAKAPADFEAQWPWLVGRLLLKRGDFRQAVEKLLAVPTVPSDWPGYLAQGSYSGEPESARGADGHPPALSTP